jgi:hypothetical protein
MSRAVTRGVEKCKHTSPRLDKDGMMDGPIPPPSLELERAAQVTAAGRALAQGWSREELDDVLGMLTWWDVREPQ